MNNKHPATVYLRQQIAAKLPSLLLWVTVWSLLLLLFATVFNSLSKDAAENSKVFQQLPSAVFSSFNIDPASYLSRIESFISGQFLSVYLLAGSIFAFSLGASAIGKKIESRTIASLLTKPIPRSRLYTVQSIANIFYLVIGSVVLCLLSLLIFNTLLQNQDSVSASYFTNLYLGSCLLFIVFTLLGQLLGTILSGGKSVIIGAGVVVVSWFVNSLAANLPDAVQKLSLFSYFDVTLLRTQYSIAVGLTLQLVVIGIVLFIIGQRIFRNKDIYI